MVPLLFVLMLLFHAGATAAIFDDDSRTQAAMSREKTVRAHVGLSVALVEENRMTLSPETREYSPSFSKTGLCAEERFSSEPSLAYCSGIFIGPTTVLTAAHCVMTDEQCRETLLITGYRVGETGSLKRSFARNDVYRCRKISRIAYESTLSERPRLDIDYALLETDRANASRSFPVIDTSGHRLRQGLELLALGYPMGLPAKASRGRIQYLGTPNRFFTDLDTLQSSSGSPVFDRESGKIIGVVSSSLREETTTDSHRQCLKIKPADSARATFWTGVSSSRAFDLSGLRVK